MTIRVTVWNEFRHEKENGPVKEIYPGGIHEAIAAHLRKDPQLDVHTATLDEPDHGLTDAVLDKTDVLAWWGHIAHHEVGDAIVEKIHDRILRGMGFIGLHSGHWSKIFKKLMGTTCNLTYREAGEKERIWIVEPNHPIAQGLDRHFEIEHEEMYGERFDVPAPETLVMLGWFKGGEVFRSGCCYTRGLGKIFYFQPGHESYPTYYNANVLKVICNAVKWAAPARIAEDISLKWQKELEPIQDAVP